ncbi:MAG: acyl-CoA thioesterase [Pseudomonadota bacterium]
MYPFLRMIGELAINLRAPDLPFDGVHVSHHRCWPWDLDPWVELNNGRTLTLYDLGRMPLAVRTGLVKAMRQKRWSLTMAGVSVRYRRRIRLFERFEMRSRCVGWDARFFYLDQSMWIGETCAGQALYRSAVVDREGIVSPYKVAEAMGLEPDALVVPDWVQAWIDADAERPWPPARDP